jgi:Tfp pilus assembly protein FimV
MTDKPDFYTKTMAKVYADQGYLTKAAEIYRFLLKQEPDRQDLPDRQSLIDEPILFYCLANGLISC